MGRFHTKNVQIIDKLWTSYICWTISVWLLVYFQLNVTTIDNTYRFVIWLFILSGCFLYKDSYREITKEIIKSGTILIITNILELHLVGDITIKKILDLTIVQIGYQMPIYVYIFLFRYLKILHGKYAYRLAILYMLILGFFCLQ